MALSPAERDTTELVRRGSVLLAGGYAWTATVLHVAAQRGVPTAARVVAALAAAALLGGSAVALRSPRLARLLALHGFALGSVLTWILARMVIDIERLDPVRGAAGCVAWALFALAWGAPREVTHVPEDDPGVIAGDPLAPRSQLVPGSPAIVAITLLAAFVPIASAWRVTRASHALLAHVLAAALAIAIVGVGAEAAARRRSPAPDEPTRRMAGAMLPLTILGLLLVAGAAVQFLR